MKFVFERWIFYHLLRYEVVIVNKHSMSVRAGSEYYFMYIIRKLFTKRIIKTHRLGRLL